MNKREMFTFDMGNGWWGAGFTNEKTGYLALCIKQGHKNIASVSAQGGKDEALAISLYTDSDEPVYTQGFAEHDSMITATLGRIFTPEQAAVRVPCTVAEIHAAMDTGALNWKRMGERDVNGDNRNTTRSWLREWLSVRETPRELVGAKGK